MRLSVRSIERVYIIVSLIILMCTFFNMINSYIVNMYILVFTFGFISVMTLFYRNLSIYQLFLFSFFFFLLGRIVLNAIGADVDMRVLTLYQNTYMSPELANQTIKVLLVFLIGTSYAWLKLNKSKGRSAFDRYVKKPSFNRLLEWLFYIYIVFFIIKMGYVINAMLQYGYVSIFTGKAFVKTPIFLTGAAKISESLFIVLMFFNRDKKSFKKYCGLILLAGIVKLFTGQRAYVFVLLLYILFLWSTYYKEIRFNNYKLICIVLLAPIIIQQINNFRWRSQNHDPSNIYVHVIRGQSVSLEVVADVIDLKDKFTNNVPFFWGYITDLFQDEPKGQVIEDIIYGNYLGDHLTYTLNEKSYFAGRGTGTSIVAEGYELVNGNLFLLFIFGYLIAYSGIFLSKNMYRNIYVFALSYYFLTDFIFSPRDSVLKSIPDFFFAAVFCFLISLCMRKYRVHRLSKVSST